MRLSTILLSVIAEHHTCFTIAMLASLERVPSAPHLRQDQVNFVIGPFRFTMLRHGFMDRAPPQRAPAAAFGDAIHKERARLLAENAALVLESWRITAPMRAITSSLRGR
jgi:hypothetical protein